MSSATLTENPEVGQLLSRCRRQIVRHTLLTGTATLLIVVITYLLTATALDYLIGLPATVRAVLLFSFCLISSWAGWKFMVAPLNTHVSETELGAAIDLSCPDLNESLATLISVERPEATVGESGSAVMRGRLRDQVAAQLGQIEFREVVNNNSARKRCGVAAALLVGALLPLLLWPSRSQLLMRRMITPYANLETAGNLHFNVADGNRTVARGANVSIAATPGWRTDNAGVRPEQVELRLTAATGHTESLPMTFDEIGGAYIAEISRIAKDVRFRVVGGGVRTELFTISVVDAPEIQLAVMTATPPVYTGRAVERFDGMLGEMSVFERSTLEILLEFNKPVSSATLLWIARDQRPLNETELMDREFDNVTGEEIPDEDPLAGLVDPAEPLATHVEGALTPDGTAAVFTMTADVGGDFVFEVIDEFRLTNPSEPDRRIQVVYDRPPEVTVSGISDGDRFRPDDIIPVNVFSIDDIGIGELELHYRQNEGVTKIIPAIDLDHGASEVTYGFRLKLTDFEVASGDTVMLRVRVADERPEPGPQEVWSNEFTIRVDDNAKAAGARALEQETKELIDALKTLEQQLDKDAKKASELGENAHRAWDDSAREQTQRLSEKEQQQGRILDQLAEEVATHPMMQESAVKLQDLGEQIRDDVPEMLDAATKLNRSEVPQQLQESANTLEDIRRELQAEIAKIEETALLEQDLAELNRLAIDAQQLANDAEQLDQDRKDPARRLEDMSEQQWQQQLEQRQQELNAERQQLSAELGQLLQEQPELLDSAQRAQREQLTELAQQARELAEQQHRVATGVDEEAQQVSRETRQLAKDLEQVRQETTGLNEQMKKLNKPATAADVDKLEAAVRELRRGNLAVPQQNAIEVAAELQTAERELAAPAKGKDAANDNDTPDNEPQADSPQQTNQRQAAAEQSARLADRLEQISDQLQQLREDRNTAAPQTDAASSEAQSAVTDPDQLPSGEQQDGPVRDLLERLDQLAEAAAEVSDGIQTDASASDEARQTADQTAGSAQQGHEEASAGRFARSAEQLRQASDTANQTSQQLSNPDQQDQRQQTQDMSNELRRMADIVDRLQQDDASQSAAQKQSQQDIAQQTAQLPQQLGDLAERLNLPELAMQQEGQQTQEAQQAAGAARQESRHATSQLQQGELQNAVESGRDTETQLNRLAELAEQAGQQPNDQPSPVPTEVGESVAEALQDLQQAAQAMQQSSEQDGESQQSDQSSEQAAQGEQGQPSQGDQAAAGEGQPSGQPSQGDQQGQDGQPSPGSEGQQGQPTGSQQLSDAAQQLAQAAEQALPEQFNPGQMSDGSQPSTAGRDAMGNVSMWDGLVPDAAGGMAGSRNWGQLNEELDTETSDGVAASRDSEYQALIRMYFREVANATAARGSAD
ncbi:MAG: hypothetical protein GY758_25040 [Fuerstiella sp.]|nr:hypothetical protein [Fuerstiella sp.]